MSSLKKIDNAFIFDHLCDVPHKTKIGGSTRDKLIPNLNISFLFEKENEYFFNLNRKDKRAVPVSDTPEIGGVDTDVFHISSDGRLKWDIEWDSIEDVPDELVFEIKCSKGLQFFYQGELTEDEKTRGRSRPDDVVGSYAVYIDKANGKYKTGKVMHLYRPFLIDSDGNKKWCSQKIANNKLTITNPKDRSGMVGKVRLDPSIGYTIVGASVDRPYGSYGLYSNYSLVMPEAGTASKVYFYCTNSGSGSASVPCGYYNQVWNEGYSKYYPHTVISQSTVSVAAGASAQWYSLNVSGSLTSGERYYPAVRYESCGFYYDSSTGLQSWWSGSSSGALTNDPAIQSGTYEMTAIFSMYLEYTTSGGGISIPVVAHHLRQQEVQ